MDWKQFLTDLATLMATAQPDGTGSWSPFFDALAKLIQDAQANATPALTGKLEALRQAIPPHGKPEARDWSGFFSALASFAQTIIPLITSFFSTTSTKK